MSYFILSLIIFLPIVSDTYTQQSFFAYIYDTPKWILLYVFASFYLLYSVVKRKKIILKYPSFLQLPFLFYMMGLLLVLLFAPAGNRETVLLEHLLFLVITFCFYSCLKEDKDFLKKLSIYTFIGLALLGVAVFVSRVYWEKRLLPFFGSPTMYGEYMGSLLVVASFFVLFLKNSKKNLWLKISVLCLGLGALFVIQSRAPLLAYIIAFTFMLFRKNLHLKVKRALILVALLAGIFAVLFTSLNAQKAQSIDIRKIRWMNTLEMIVDKPVGSGLGNYTAAYGEFQNKRAFDIEADERSIIGNPHNAFLELAAESGVISALAFLMMLFLSLSALLGIKSPYATLCLGLLVYWMIDAFFNFPQDCPASYFFFTLVSGLLLFVFSDKKLEMTAFASYVLRGVVLVVLILFSYRQYFSEVITFRNMNDEKVLTHACKLDPQNWRACLRSVSLSWARGESEKALRLLEALELRFPEHYIIRKKTIQLIFESGNTEKGCEHLRIYDRRFNDNSSLHSILLQKCT